MIAKGLQPWIPILIVAAIGVANGWIGADWLVILAIALSCTFIMAAPANSLAHAIYARWSERLRRFESAERMAEDAPLDTGKATGSYLVSRWWICMATATMRPLMEAVGGPAKPAPANPAGSPCGGPGMPAMCFPFAMTMA